jgi:integrase
MICTPFCTQKIPVYKIQKEAQAMSLTELALKNLKPKDRRYRVRDDQGLYIEIMPTGRKYWRVRYMVEGKAHVASVGEYPYITLKDARQKRDDVRGVIITGIEPSKPERTFYEIAEEWLETHIRKRCSQSHTEKTTYRLNRFLYPKFRDRDIGSITAQEILEISRALQDSDRIETAHRVKQIAGQVFRYAIAIGEAERDVTADLRGALRPNIGKSYGAAKTPQEARAVLLAIDAYNGGPVVKNALWFSAYTFVRPGNVRHAEWTEIDFGAAEWRIPKDKGKTRRSAHIVPLATQAISILNNMKALTGHGRYVFPSPRAYTKGDVPMSENAVNAALRHMGFTGDEMTAHGFRHMATTLLYEQGWTPELVERQMGHKVGSTLGSKVREAYDYAQLLVRRRKMMQIWADCLDYLIKPDPAIKQAIKDAISAAISESVTMEGVWEGVFEKE